MSHHEIQPTTYPAGWYQNPQNTTELVYWDGAAWRVDLTRPPEPTAQTADVIVAWVVAILSLGYMLPWAVAVHRGMPNAGAIGLVNLLTGWTLVGWLVALVMASMQRQA